MYAARFVNAFGTFTLTELMEDLSLCMSLDIPEEKVPRRHGSYVADEVSIGSPTLHLNGHLSSYDASYSVPVTDAFLATAMETTRGKLYFNASRYLNCWARNVEIRPVRGTAFSRWTFESDFWADDPFWSAASATTVTEVTAANPWAFSVNNTGDTPVYPLFRVTANQGAAVSGLVLTNATTGKTWAYSGTVQINKVFEFDAANFTAVNDGVGDMPNVPSGTVAVWLAKGWNNLSLVHTNNCKFEVIFTPRWFGPSYD